MVMLMVVETAKCFRKFDLGNQALAVVFAFAYLPYLGFSAKEKYIDPDKREKFKKSATREWVDALLFAVIAATIIRTFLLKLIPFLHPLWKSRYLLVIICLLAK